MHVCVLFDTADKYETVDMVRDALQTEGLESCNLIIGMPVGLVRAPRNATKSDLCCNVQVRHMRCPDSNNVIFIDFHSFGVARDPANAGLQYLDTNNWSLVAIGSSPATFV